ncbi:MAG: sulfite exporter TauE/SafE family protein [gamma proteobacterium symbiont of Bathyaustriella thionipta]|nr:sulfite exporter TauE/SafE family protein [gamma proteobacterium symbiont of Bathyaustriella thionipta]MCU7950725.1 sulfite exporter TauE/SafE family protein [gamma proteobacterium symbiont of Bathyaustriella thionipta]MCU7953276.1 sulfite exporter TauE/SafE family protein [gamma proteobacterium symbiont of Bathyaustriella thionipta]MCU7957217.1 sulfite exporter TauE/SafE family protein [gamma proteobacterium symbiont of Bathyaustriella thionipta]MCU7966533.1 sulfite exporter TauE/SafE famil
MSISIIIAGLITGMLLGVFGSGGSIITMPALLYLLDVEPKSAIAMSLGIVAVTATITAVQHWRHGNVDLRITAVFGLFGVIGTYFGALLGVITPVIIQLSIFALVMYAAAWKMLKPESQNKSQQHRSVGAMAVDLTADNTDVLNYTHIALHGIAVGILTGIVGVGGGFLIVPALVLLSGLPMKKAVGTSLSIVSLKSFAGFAGYAGSVAIDYQMMGIFTVIAVAGSVVGSQLGHRLPADLLKRGFGGFLLLVASYILFKSVLFN